MMRPTYQELVDEFEAAKDRLANIENREQLEQFAISLLSTIQGAAEVMDNQANQIEWCVNIIRELADFCRKISADDPEFCRDLDKLVAMADEYVKGL